MRKKLLIGFGLGSALAMTLAFAADKAAPPAEKEAQKAAITVEGKAQDCERPQSHCAKPAGTAGHKASGEQNMASSGKDTPNSADCPKEHCEKFQCDKHKSQKSGQAHGDHSHKAETEPKATTEL